MAAPMRISRFLFNSLCGRSLVGTPFHSKVRQKYTLIKTHDVVAKELAAFRAEYTDEQQAKILHVINGDNLDQFLKYEVSRTMAVNIINKRDSRRVGGKFRNLEDLVFKMPMVDLGLLHILCDSIVFGLSKEGRHAQSLRWQLCHPSVPEELTRELNSVVVLQLHSDGATWLHLSRERRILDWQHWTPTNFEKVRENRESLQLARSIVDKLAVADAYLIDDRKLSTSALFLTPLILHTVRVECMIATMLQERDGAKSHRVFLLKNDLVASYFRLRVGNEQVSGQDLVEAMFAGSSTNDTLQRTIVDETSKSSYLKQPRIIREHMANLLLKAVAFYKMAVAKVPMHAAVNN